MSERQFELKPAVREAVPLIVSLVGPSSSGKTYSALRIASGMQRVVGGDVAVIDTESRRALHYSETFRFKHLDFKAPFSPDDYLKAIEHVQASGASIVVVDSMSHEHEGTGGVLEWHEAELDRMAGDNQGRRNAMTFAAWAAPKAARRRLINRILQLGVNAVLCFRAKEKIKIPKRGAADREVKELGWMPIAGEEWIYESTLQALLEPNSGGIPNWNPDGIGSRTIVKLPAQFHGLFEESKPLDESIGEALATWAKGGAAPKVKDTPADPALSEEFERTLDVIATSDTEAELRGVAKSSSGKSWSTEQRAQIKMAINARQAEILAAARGGE